jgi:Transposase
MDRQYVGIDFHRRRSVIVRKNAAGEKLSSVRVANDPWVIAAAVAEAGPSPEVVIEATYGWYWIVDWLQQQGATVHLANPSGLNWGTRRVKNDERDAIDLIDMLRLGRLPEAWIAPPATGELRELVRYRAKLVALRSGLKAQVHAVWPKKVCFQRCRTCSVPLAPSRSTRWPSVMRTRSGSSHCAISSRSMTVRLACSRRRSGNVSVVIGGIGRFRRSVGSARRWPRSWLPRLVT